MATQTNFVTGQQAHVDLAGRVINIENTIDFSTFNCSSADVVQALNIPANAFLIKVFCIVRTAEGATCTAKVGDTTHNDGWDASADLNAAAGTVTCSLEATDTYGIGKLYTSAGTIDLTLNNNAATAKVTVAAAYIMLDR